MEVSKNQTRGKSMSKIIRIGIDLSKSTFVVYGVNAEEHCALKRTLKRKDVLNFFANIEPCNVAMESGSGAHHWARLVILFFEVIYINRR